MMIDTNWLARFLARVEMTTGCWRWRGALDKDGYGVLTHRPVGVSSRAHRASYWLFVGGLDRRLTLDHLCRNRACVNPEHLEQVSDRVNVLRGSGPAAVNARKTFCKRGHPLFGSNLSIRRGGARRCLACHRSANAKR